MGLLEALGGGLGYVGDAIDKPGRAVRGALAGKGREALSFIPFSDSMGLTDARQRTSGRDLTDAYGITDKHSRSWGSSAAGFGADLLTDPLSWAGAGLAAKGAKTFGAGLKAGAKSLTGLDLIDSLRSGGSKLYHSAKDGVADSTVGLWNDLSGVHGPTTGPFGMDAIGRANHLSDGSRSAAGHPRDSLLGRLGGDGDLANAAIVHGPQYPGGLDKLRELYSDPKMNGQGGFHLGNIRSTKGAADYIAGEIPEGSRFLGQGDEAITFRAPQGHVIRVQHAHGVGRAAIPEMLQPFRATSHANFTVEHAPRVHTKDSLNATLDDLGLREFGQLSPVEAREFFSHYDPFRKKVGHAQEAFRDEVYRTSDAIDRKGYHTDDYAPHNVGFTDDGNLVAFDPGAIPGPERMPFNAPAMVGKGQAIPADLLARLGTPSLIRDAIDRGAAAGNRGLGVPAPKLTPHLGLLPDLARLRESNPGQLARFLEAMKSRVPDQADEIDEMVRLMLE